MNKIFCFSFFILSLLNPVCILGGDLKLNCRHHYITPPNFSCIMHVINQRSICVHRYFWGSTYIQCNGWFLIIHSLSFDKYEQIRLHFFKGNQNCEVQGNIWISRIREYRNSNEASCLPALLSSTAFIFRQILFSQRRKGPSHLWLTSSACHP